ncbi:MAG TPA: D-aminoacyl-tRNA deacylase [Terriglobales bacterium]|nr:D-aminoacyl-tRNA deacylase [Terriglobales bacterium]
MTCVLQCVRRAAVRVAGEVVGAIGPGYLALIGVERGDGPADVDYLCRKLQGLRLWPDAQGKMNLSLVEAHGAAGAVLAVSQFTLLGDTRRGLRPSFDAAAPPAEARLLYQSVVDQLRSQGLHVETGVFQAEMEVELVNQGPVTILLDSRNRTA